MQEAVENNSMTLHLYREHYRELVACHRGKYINHSMPFILWIKRALRKFGRGFSLFLYYENMRKRMHDAKPVTSIEEILDNIVVLKG